MGEKKSSEIASHGRGGAGNIGPDTTTYVDGEIVREGAVGDHGDGAYSAGRGGAGNIGSPGLPATVRKDGDVIPESALRPSSDDQAFHAGRGGAGNAIRPEPATKHPQGFTDKIKNKLFKKKVEKTEPETKTT